MHSPHLLVQLLSLGSMTLALVITLRTARLTADQLRRAVPIRLPTAQAPRRR